MIQNTSVWAMGVKYFPSMPVRVRIGKKTIRMIRTANVALRTTFEAPLATSASISSCVSFLRSPRPYRWARMPSRITIEPSTTIPKSMAPKLMRLADTPKMRIRINPNNMANGMTEATISPARILPKNSIKTTKTMRAPSTKFRITVEMFRLTSSERFR